VAVMLFGETLVAAQRLLSLGGHDHSPRQKESFHLNPVFFRSRLSDNRIGRSK
jgi:hypothetical protein